SANTYTDAAAAGTLASANGYADNRSADALASANGYTDSLIAVNNTGGYADPEANGDNAMAAGSGAVASAANSLAVGMNARATGANAIAIGSGAVATGSVAVGTDASAGNGGSAVGDYATATGEKSAALGQGATSTGENSAAIGSNSTDDGADNVVSVGSQGNERRIVYVDYGVDAYDAVNVYQAQSYASATLASANDYTDDRINDLDQEANRSIAGAIAMSRAFLPLAPGESGVAMGFGNSHGKNAVALSVQHYTTRNIHLNLGTSMAGGNVQTGGGIGLKF
ncbi:MAG: YadA-like family protein, partial [Thermodesulfobacteriota bacterium]